MFSIINSYFVFRVLMPDFAKKAGGLLGVRIRAVVNSIVKIVLLGRVFIGYLGVLLELTLRSATNIRVSSDCVQRLLNQRGPVLL